MENRRPGDGNGFRGRGRGRGGGGGGGGGTKRPHEGGDDDDNNSDADQSSRGRARGRGGGGRGGGGRGRKTFAERRQERIDRLDLVVTRSKDLITKRGELERSTKVSLLANYFLVNKMTDWSLYHYHVDFTPEEENTRVKKQLFRSQQGNLPAYIFDGSSAWMSNRLSPDPFTLTSQGVDGRIVNISVRLVAQLAPADSMYLQFYNIMIRKCLSEFLNLDEIGRYFFDHTQAIALRAQRLELWPGYKTSLRNHENSLLLCVDLTHKVLRTDSVLVSMREMGRGNFDREAIKRELVGCVVMTHYNRKTYTVNDIDWDMNPRSTFDKQGEQISFADYFQQGPHRLHVTDWDQPLLVSKPTKKDYHRGQFGPVKLVPEFCQMTGLTDEMRGNFTLMRGITQHLHVAPQERADEIVKFMRRLQSNPGARNEMERWGLEFNIDLVRVPSRVVDKETILFGREGKEKPNDQGDWTHGLKGRHKMYSSIPLECWVQIIPQRDAQGFEGFNRQMNSVSNPLAFPMSRPTQVIRIPDSRIPSYLSAIDDAMKTYKDKIQLFFVVLPKIDKDIYGAVKRKCYEYGVASQCFVVKNASKGMSVATKVVIQINAKLGGEPWSVQIPLKKLMIVGFDVHHAANRRNPSVGAMVATTTPSHARYYSTVSYHQSKEELSSNLTTDFTKCMYAYEKVNKGDFPNRIIMYRDGVGDGQLSYVYETELKQIENAMNQLYKDKGIPLPKFTFIVVSKKINTRLFLEKQGRMSNPDPGTVVDDVITLPERFDFYLVSQYARQGTVSPASYNVLCDTQGLPAGADKLQRLTFKLCHTYFNWSGTVTVPAPCQYAHKLAFLTGIALQGGTPSEALSHTLHFL